MTDFRKNLEIWFEKFGYIIFNNRIRSLLVVLAIVAATGSQIPKITADLSMESLPKKSLNFG